MRHRNMREDDAVREAFEAFEKSLFTIYRTDEYGKTRLQGVTNV